MEEQSRLPESARCPPGTEELGGRRDGESSEQGEMEDGIDKQLRSGDRPRLGAYMRVVCECGWVRGGKSCHGSRLCCLLLFFFVLESRQKVSGLPSIALLSGFFSSFLSALHLCCPVYGAG